MSILKKKSKIKFTSKLAKGAKGSVQKDWQKILAFRGKNRPEASCCQVELDHSSLEKSPNFTMIIDSQDDALSSGSNRGGVAGLRQRSFKVWSTDGPESGTLNCAHLLYKALLSKWGLGSALCLLKAGHSVRLVDKMLLFTHQLPSSSPPLHRILHGYFKGACHMRYFSGFFFFFLNWL